MSKSITIPFSQAGLERAADWLEDYVKSLKDKASELLNAMLKEGEMTAKLYLEHIDTGQTLNSIMGYRNGNKGVIVVGGNAIWIEFGTGVVANEGNAPHPKAAELNMSPWGTYGYGLGASPDGWYYKRADGQVRHTYGIPSNPFMYETAKMLRRQCPRMAREVFK